MPLGVAPLDIRTAPPDLRLGRNNSRGVTVRRAAYDRSVQAPKRDIAQASAHAKATPPALLEATSGGVASSGVV